MAGISNGDLTTCKKITISTIAVFSTIICFGYFFESTCDLASKFFLVQYPVGDRSDATLFGYGPADCITLLFYVASAMIFTSVIEDLIQTLNLSPKNDFFSQQMTQILFYASSFLFGLYVLNKGNYDLATFWNGFPDNNVPFLLKVFYLTQLAFLVQCFPQAMLQGLSPLESLTSLIEAEVLMVFLVATYAVNYTPMAAAVLMAHYAAKLLYQLAALSSDSKSFRLYVKLALFGAEQILDLGAAICIYLYSDSRGHSIRCIAVAAAVISAALGGWTIYKDITNNGNSNGSNLPFLLTTTAARKGRRSSKGRGRKGNGGRGDSQRKRRK